MKTLTLTDDLQHRIALVRWTADQGDAAALDARKIELAEAILTAVDRRAGSRAARLNAVATPRLPLAAGVVDVQLTRKRRRA